MNAQTVDHLISSKGLLFDLGGATLLALGLFVSPSKAIELRGQSGLSFYSDGGGATPEQMLRQPAVVDLMRQTRYARWGCSLLFLGFLFQLAGTWLPQLLSS